MDLTSHVFTYLDRRNLPDLCCNLSEQDGDSELSSSQQICPFIDLAGHGFCVIKRQEELNETLNTLRDFIYAVHWLEEDVYRHSIGSNDTKLSREPIQFVREKVRKLTKVLEQYTRTFSRERDLDQKRNISCDDSDKPKGGQGTVPRRKKYLITLKDLAAKKDSLNDIIEEIRKSDNRVNATNAFVNLNAFKILAEDALSDVKEFVEEILRKANEARQSVFDLHIPQPYEKKVLMSHLLQKVHKIAKEAEICRYKDIELYESADNWNEEYTRTPRQKSSISY